jgi:hypothetical protein
MILLVPVDAGKLFRGRSNSNVRDMNSAASIALSAWLTYVCKAQGLLGRIRRFRWQASQIHVFRDYHPESVSIVPLHKRSVVRNVVRGVGELKKKELRECWKSEDKNTHRRRLVFSVVSNECHREGVSSRFLSSTVAAGCRDQTDLSSLALDIGENSIAEPSNCMYPCILDQTSNDTNSENGEHYKEKINLRKRHGEKSQGDLNINISVSEHRPRRTCR